MQNTKIFATLFVAISALFLNTSANAATTVKSAIGPGDVGPIITKPFDQVSFENYVADCKTELEIDAIPQMDCNDINFRNPDANTIPELLFSTDYVTHAKINSVVDAVFACRWVRPSVRVNKTVPEGGIIAASGEMLVHNKETGKSCFFKMKPGNITQPIETLLASQEEIIATTNPPSPTAPNGFAFWDTPTKVLKEACTQCHAAGPWIASPQIVGALGQFGLINDGHDTLNQRYTAIGSNGAQLNQYAQDTLAIGASQYGNCSSGCHVIAGTGLRGDDVQGDSASLPNGGSFFPIIIPSISRVINDIRQGGYMRPNDPHSDYRWVNLDSPAGCCGDWERLKDLKANLPQFVCKTGVAEVQAHVVDSGRRMSTADFPDVLHTFNLLDGLVCRNADQADGHTCADYQTRYHCGSGAWTKWRNLSTPNGDGDDESRANFPSMCADPTEIQARIVLGGKVTASGFGPPDRLQEFDLNGVACRNASQPSGQCQDYTVRFVCAQ